MPAAGTIGSLDKRVLEGPWDTTFDFTLIKAHQDHGAELDRSTGGCKQSLQPSDVPDRQPDRDVIHLRKDHEHVRRQSRVPVLHAVSGSRCLLAAGQRKPAPKPTHTG